MAALQSPSTRPSADEFDVVVAGASIAGCSTALVMARAGLSVLLVEPRPDPAAYKVVCGHNILGSAIPAIERLGLLGPMLDAGAVRSRFHATTKYGVVTPPDDPAVPPGINLRRRHLDPLLRDTAANEPGVELMLGTAVAGLCNGRDAVTVELEARDGTARSVSAQLLVAADGRESPTARLAGIRARVAPNIRVYYAAYFRDARPLANHDIMSWLEEPNFFGAFPTDDGLTGFYCMPTIDELARFKRDPEGSVREFAGRYVGRDRANGLEIGGDLVGRVDLSARLRDPARGRVALVGDSAVTADPLWGVGCGWAFQQAEWLAGAVAPALLERRSPEQALTNYRRTLRRRLLPHMVLFNQFARRRRWTVPEHLAMRAGPADPVVAETMQRLLARTISPLELAKPLAINALIAGNLRASGLLKPAHA